MFAAAALLESYLRQIQSIEGNLREADENIDTVREVWVCHPALLAAPVYWPPQRQCVLGAWQAAMRLLIKSDVCHARLDLKLPKASCMSNRGSP